MMCQAFCTCIILQKGKPTWRCCLSSQKLRKNTEPPSWKEVSGRRRGRQAQNQKGSVGWYFQVSQLLALSCSGFTLPFVSIPQALTWTRFLERVTLSQGSAACWVRFISQATLEWQCFLKLEPFLPWSLEWIPAPLYCAYCWGMHTMQTGCLVQDFGLHGPELCFCSHSASSDFFLVFLALLSCGFSIFNYLSFRRGYWNLLSETDEWNYWD